MATSPTPSLDSIRGGTNSIESYGEHNGYLSDSPLTLSGSSPPVSDSAICDEFISASSTNKQHHPISASVSSSSASSTSSSSGLSGCGSTSSAGSSNNGATSSGTSPGVIGSNLNNGGSSGGSGVGGGSRKGSPCGGLLSNSSNNLINVSTANDTGAAPRCTACKSKQSDAVAKCFDCISFLCSNCVTAHHFMHCFSGHNICYIKGYESNIGAAGGNGASQISPALVAASHNPASADFKYSGLTMMLQQQQRQQQQPLQQQQQHPHHSHQQQLQKQQQEPLSQLSKIVHAASTAAAAANAVFSNDNDHHHNGSGNIFASLLPPTRSAPSSNASSQMFCHRHKHELLKFNCRSCNAQVCKECVVAEHSSGVHEIEHVQEHSLPASVAAAFNPQNPPESIVQSLLSDIRCKVGEIVPLVNNSDNSIAKIKMQYQKAHNDVSETYQFFCSMLDERKQELLKELESLFNAKIASNSAWLQRSNDLIEKAVQTCEAIERSPKAHSVSDVLMLKKTLELQMQSAMQDMQLPFELEFMSNYQSIQAGVRNTFGYIRPAIDASNNCNFVQKQPQPPIARPTNNQSSSNSSSSSVTGGSQLVGSLGLAANLLENSYGSLATVNNGLSLVRSNNNHHMGNGGGGGNNGNSYEDLMPKRYQNNAVSPFVPGVPVNAYDKWSNGGNDNIFSTQDPFSGVQLLSSLASSVNSVNGAVGGNNSLNALNITHGSLSSADSIMDLTSKILCVSQYPPKSQIKRQKMIYHCKFGEFGVMEGQFTEPSGVAVNAQNDIIVADTNNHRIQIFDKEGRFKFQFGECGKRDSQLLYPNRVAVVRTSGDIIVTERSPTHQIQIYNQYGQFVRKFGANILQHPRGVTVDNKGRIIVVECKVMRVIIFDQNGVVLHKFGCSKHLEFPNGVVVNDNQEIFISDNRAHCVKVFNYEGHFLRQIGGEGVTNYPIGVGINLAGEILIADNHNNFNLTIFKQDGQLVSALESKVKHAQCFDVALMDDGSVVLASKDYRLYIYRYVQVLPGMN